MENRLVDTEGIMPLKTIPAAVAVALTAAVMLSAQSQTTPPTIGAAQEPPAAAQLPDGDGKDVTVRVCGQCHEPERSASLRLTREGWAGVVQKMADLGASATSAELQQITDYLATSFKGEALSPLNLNTASSVELESVAGLLRKEAALWIAYRTTTGHCKTLEDLKKVPGFPFKKIDERRDHLVCF
jgi:competence protein ComEA